MSLRFTFGLLVLLAPLASSHPLWGDEPISASHQLTAFSQGDWPFCPPELSRIPDVERKEWVANPIDAFILARLEDAGLQPNASQSRRSLLRRLTFDLTGLPPTIEEQAAFEADQSPYAYERVVERLLSSPQFGARWGQHWLDLVRFAESDGFKADSLRPSAYRYRDYVVQSVNSDLGYDVFVQQQLAGDEIEPDNIDALVATGLNRLYPDEDNAANLFQRRQEILDDITETTGLAFMGLTMGCAQCHDHKFDDILQEDYFRLQAFFAPMAECNEVLPPPEERAEYNAALERWNTATQQIREAMDELLAAEKAKAQAYSLSKFEAAIQECYLTPAEQRTPYQEQIARIAHKQVEKGFKLESALKNLSKAEQAEYRELETELSRFNHLKPPPLPTAMAVRDVAAIPPPTHVLDGGDWKSPLDEVTPGYPVFLGTTEPNWGEPQPVSATTGRRTALAQWLTAGEHPLTARVMVNRLWQHHFGRGIVATTSDFGLQGAAPSHPELLDWLAVELVNHGWSLKHIHRLMVCSSTYRQSSQVDQTWESHQLAMRADPENQLLWHANRRRLEGEAIRDAMLTVSGQLDFRTGGPSSKPRLPEGLSKRYAWVEDKELADQRRRSAYVLVKRNMRFPMFDAFDYPDMHNSCGQRTQTTTPPQALLMFNGDEPLELANEWARGLHAELSSNKVELTRRIYLAALAREPEGAEVEQALAFLDSQSKLADATMPGRTPLAQPISQQAVADLCHAIFNCNEFIYID
jgi:hypothetical protein